MLPNVKYTSTQPKCQSSIRLTSKMSRMIQGCHGKRLKLCFMRMVLLKSVMATDWWCNGLTSKKPEKAVQTGCALIGLDGQKRHARCVVSSLGPAPTREQKRFFILWLTFSRRSRVMRLRNSWPT